MYSSWHITPLYGVDGKVEIIRKLRENLFEKTDEFEELRIFKGSVFHLIDCNVLDFLFNLKK